MSFWVRNRIPVRIKAFGQTRNKHTLCRKTTVFSLAQDKWDSTSPDSGQLALRKAFILLNATISNQILVIMFAIQSGCCLVLNVVPLALLLKKNKEQKKHYWSINSLSNTLRFYSVLGVTETQLVTGSTPVGCIMFAWCNDDWEWQWTNCSKSLYSLSCQKKFQSHVVNVKAAQRCKMYRKWSVIFLKLLLMENYDKRIVFWLNLSQGFLFGCFRRTHLQLEMYCLKPQPLTQEAR